MHNLTKKRGGCQKWIPHIYVGDPLSQKPSFPTTAALDKKYADRIKNKQIQKLDIIKNVRFRGDIAQNNLVIENMARPQSLQLKVKKLVGSPIPYQRLQGVQTRGCKRKAPVIEGLSEVVGIERLVLFI